MRSSGYAVGIPVKNNAHLTRDLLSDLARDDTYGLIVITDNGSDPEEFQALIEIASTMRDVVIAEMPDVGIHHQWNTQIQTARLAGWPLIALLNNDVRLAHGCLDRLEQVMADPGIGICCPNYDGRPEQGLVDTDMVCGGLYDGTGGIAGFAFMIRTHGYRFPEELKWWCGDAHVVGSMLSRGLRAVVVTDVAVEHVNGGGQTGDWQDPAMQMQLKSDFATARRLVAR